MTEDPTMTHSRSHLNPGIAKVVLWLNGRGFETCDSGDGRTHDRSCDREYAYVVIEVPRVEALLPETERLCAELHSAAPDLVNRVSIQATYTPHDGLALIDLSDFPDAAESALRALNERLDQCG